MLTPKLLYLKRNSTIGGLGSRSLSLITQQVAKAFVVRETMKHI